MCMCTLYICCRHELEELIRQSNKQQLEEGGRGKGQAKTKSKIDELVAYDCVLCGEMMIM